MLINDPILGAIDITPVLPIIDHRLFQRLRFIRQLGVSYMIFPSANHTRLEHCIGSYQRTKERNQYWLADDVISKQEARDVEIYGLTHDIGHGPLSHLIEPICSKSHDERGLEIIEQLADAIKKSGGNFENIYSMFTRKNPLYKTVHDKNLGTEKLDYLERDSHYAAYGHRPGVNKLTLFVNFQNGELAIDPRAIDEAIQLQMFYIQMYKNVYLRKGTTILQRMVQRMICGLMRSGLDEYNLWEMTDDDLMVEFRRSRKRWIRDYDQRFLTRDLPKTAITFKQRRYIEREVPTHRKASKTFGIDGDTMKTLIGAYSDPYVIEEAELKMAKMAGLPPWSVLLIPVIDPDRFVPQDVKIKSRDGLDSLKEGRPDHFRSMEETAKSYISIRVATFPEFREKLAKAKLSYAVAEFVVENAEKIVKESA